MGLFLALPRPAPAAAPAQSARLRAEDPWIRWLPAAVPAAGYLKLINGADQPATLLGASSAAFAEVSLHQTIERGGAVTMVPVQRLTVAAHSTLDFAAAGYHFMLLHARAALKPADRVLITLRFADGSALTVPFEVRR